MKPLRFILVGLGARSRIWRQMLAEHPDYRIVGLVETDAECLATALGETPGALGGHRH